MQSCKGSEALALGLLLGSRMLQSPLQAVHLLLTFRSMLMLRRLPLLRQRRCNHELQHTSAQMQQS